MDMKQTRAASLLAMTAGLTAGLGFAGFGGFRMPTVRRERNYPVPPCSSPEVITEWNANVSTRQVRRHRERHGI